MTALWLGFAVVIAYGSIYPFDFQAQPLDTLTLRAFLDSCCNQPGRGDVLGNIVLFVPFGFLGLIAASERSSLSRRVWSVSIAGVVFAFLLQVAQIYLPSRDENLQDVVWNLIGIFTGAQIGVFSYKYFSHSSRFARGLHLIPSLLIGSWLIYRLIPFVPSIDLQVIKDSLKPLLLTPEFDAVDISANTVAWLVIASLLKSVRRGARLDKYLPALIMGVFSLEVLIVHNAISASNVAGAALALTLWWGVLRNFRTHAGVLSLLLCATLIVEGLAPFTLNATPGSFAWLPFRGLLGGSMYVNVQAICYKVFVYGSLVYLLWQTRLGQLTGVVLAVGVTAFVEFVQIYIVGHTPEITDPLLLVLAALTMLPLRNFDRRPYRRVTPTTIDDLGSKLVEQTINLRGYQAEFLTRRAKHMQVSVSEVSRWIIDEFIEEQSKSAAALRLDSTATAATHQNAAPTRSWVQQPVFLRPDQLGFIESLSRDRNVSVSRATRRIIARFMREGKEVRHAAAPRGSTPRPQAELH